MGKTKIYRVCAVFVIVCITFMSLFDAREVQGQEHPQAFSYLTNDEDFSFNFYNDDLDLPFEKDGIQVSQRTAAKKATSSKNKDQVGWIRIPNTNINDAIMQGKDNSYYLTRNERKEKNVWGSYFADYNADMTSIKNLDQNTVIYGHTGYDDNAYGRKFSQLFRYMNVDFVKKNPNIYLTIGDEKKVFEVFAVFYTDTSFYYIDPYPSGQGFDKFLKEVKSRNEYIFKGSSVTQEDKILTLSGCATKFDLNRTGNHRIAIMAKMLDDDSSKVTSVKRNPKPKRPKQ